MAFQNQIKNIGDKRLGLENERYKLTRQIVALFTKSDSIDKQVAELQEKEFFIDTGRSQASIMPSTVKVNAPVPVYVAKTQEEDPVTDDDLVRDEYECPVRNRSVKKNGKHRKGFRHMTSTRNAKLVKEKRSRRKTSHSRSQPKTWQDPDIHVDNNEFKHDREGKYDTEGKHNNNIRLMNIALANATDYCTDTCPTCRYFVSACRCSKTFSQLQRQTDLDFECGCYQSSCDMCADANQDYEERRWGDLESNYKNMYEQDPIYSGNIGPQHYGGW